MVVEVVVVVVARRSGGVSHVVRGITQAPG